ncbi:unnamed protein product [Brassicogethes aeneus]|uniref:E3 ubiquitin-protein ligase RBBP6 n=1 Tax=Brassicogethes aeneus TaxID=1431903 RepID=A0A9P0BKP4_BRAAE|nr:unnamed protein product [Brassicogethes aeneus]
MSVHYKFKSALDYDTVTFDGLHISVKDLKNSIIQQKRIGKSTDFDLQVTNAQTKEEYEDENALIPKNTSLLIARIPIAAQSKNKQWEGYGGDSTPPAKLEDGGPMSRTADLSCLNAPEDEKINAMMSQSTQDYDPSNYIKIRGANQVGPVPPNYRCYKCHQTGHWIKDCPLAQGSEPIEIKKSTGIPRSFMVPVEGPQVPGAMMTPNGSYAVPVLDHQAYNEKPAPAQAQQEDSSTEIPEDLLCSICHDLLTDAVMIPCCGNSFCDECIRSALLESEDHECPDCREKDISPGTLIPNRFLRTSVANFKNTTGYVKKPVYRPKVEHQQVELSRKNVTPPPKQEPPDAQKQDAAEEKTVISEADSTEQHKNDDAQTEIKEDAREPAKSTASSDSPAEGPPGVSPRSSPKPQPISNRVSGYTRDSKSKPQKRERDDRSPRKHHRSSRKRSPGYRESRNPEERSGTPTIDEPGSGGFPPDRIYNAPPGTIPPLIGGMHPMQGPPPNIPGPYPPAQAIGGFPPTAGPPPNFRLPPPGAAPPYMAQPGFPGGPRPLFDNSRPPIAGPPPNYNPNYPPGSRPHHGRDYGRRGIRERTPPGIIDDPLAAFNRMLREKDERERRNKARALRRSYSRSRSRSRSYSRSPPPMRRKRSRSPRRRGSRSRSRSFSMSRRYERDERSFRDKERQRDNRSRDRDRFYDDRYDDRRGGERGVVRSGGQQWNHPSSRGGPALPHHQQPPVAPLHPDMGGGAGYHPGYHQDMVGFSNRYAPRDYGPQNIAPMPPMHLPPQRRFDDTIAPPGVEEPPVPGLENSPPPFDRYQQKPAPENSAPSEDKRPLERRDKSSDNRRRRHERRSRSLERGGNKSSPKKRSKSREREKDSPDKHKKKKRDDSKEELSDDERSKKKSKDKKKKRDKKDSEKKRKKEKHHHKDKKPKEEFKQVIIKKKDDEVEEEKKATTPKELTPERLEATPKKTELYDDIDRSVMESYDKAEETAEIKEAEVQSEEPEEGEISNTFEEGDESEKDVLELHSSDMDLKVELDKNEVLAPVPEKSKWECEEEGSYSNASPKDSSRFDSKTDKSGKVTNEVLKRAENAIFAKAINAIRPIEIKKISSDRVKLYSGEHDSMELSKEEIIAPIVAEAEVKTPAPRVSVKERLGVKVADDGGDRVVKMGRNRSRSASPFRRRGSQGSNRHRRSRSRHRNPPREQQHSARRTDRDRETRREDPRKPERKSDANSRSKQREKSKPVAPEKRKRSRSKTPSADEQKAKKKDKKHKKEKDAKPKTEDEEQKLKQTVEKRKATIDESSFEPDYDLESESDKDESSKKPEAKKEKVEEKSSSSDSDSSSSSEDRKKRKHKKHRKKKRKDSSSSSSESESDSSEDEKQKRKKHKKKQKKRKKSKHK